MFIHFSGCVVFEYYNLDMETQSYAPTQALVQSQPTGPEMMVTY